VALIPLDPAPKVSRCGVDFVATEAGRTSRGLAATIQVFNGTVLAAASVVLADQGMRSGFAGSVATAAGPSVDVVERALLELLPAVETKLREVEAARTVQKEGQQKNIVTSAAQGTQLAFEDPEPWPEPVEGAALLDEVATTLRRFVVMRQEAGDACALWLVYSHTFDSFDTSPILAIQSPTPRCAKTTLLRLLAGMARRPYSAVGFTEATVFRLIERWTPTLLIDEADRTKDRDALIEVIDAGLERSGSVPRCVGEDYEVRAFSVWAPKVMAGIDKLTATVQDRAIVIDLQRATKAEKAIVARYRARSLRPVLTDIARRATRWTIDHEDKLVELGQREDVPLFDALDDRAAEQLWLPLLSVADAVGGDWPERARRAALTLSGGRDEEVDEESDAVLLIQDLAAIYEAEAVEFISTTWLLEALKKMEERPWKSYGGRKDGLDANKLGALLRKFKVHSRQRRLGTAPNAFRGYLRSELENVFLRYVNSDVTPVTDEAIETATTSCAVTGTTPQASPGTGAVTEEVETTAEVRRGITGVTAEPLPPASRRSDHGQKPPKETAEPGGSA